MKNIVLSVLCFALFAGCAVKTTDDLKPTMDKYQTPIGDLYIKVLGHASIMMVFFDNVIYVDPYSSVANYKRLPKASLILITHDHYDHFDIKAIKEILTPQTQVMAPKAVTDKLTGIVQRYQTLSNGESAQYKGIRIDAVPAYNIVGKDSKGKLYHGMRGPVFIASRA